MNCCDQCQGIERQFDEKYVTGRLDEYRRDGARATTIRLVEMLTERGVEGMSLLDIGGGIGAIPHFLLAAGAGRATNVEASSAFAEAGRREAAARGLSDRIDIRQGNFVELAPGIAPADIVTLDRVICCYDDVEGLITRSAALAVRYYGLVYLRDVWWVKLPVAGQNVLFRLRRTPFRLFAHPTAVVEAIARAQGLTRLARETTGEWQIVLFARIDSKIPEFH